MQNLHFFCKVPVLLAKTGRFRCIRLLPPPGFSRAERFDLKPPGLQLRAGDSRLPGNAALCRARFIKPLNRCCLILVRILPSMVSRLVPLSWTGVKYPGVRKQGRSSDNRVLDPKTNDDIQLAYCWGHARRKLFELTKNSTAQIANEGLRQITALYHIESQIRGLPALERLSMRQQKTVPRIAAFKTWLDQARSKVSVKSPTGEALKYIAKYWDGLILSCDRSSLVRPLMPALR